MDLGSVVIVSLNAPKEKVWGALRALTQAGVTVQGFDLNSFDYWLRQIVDAQPAVLTLPTVFYPMHRVERIALDEPSGEIHSLAERFLSRVGISVLEYAGISRG